MGSFTRASLRKPDRRNFRGRHKAVLVCGNGPSLADAPVEMFSQYPTLGANSIYRVPHFAKHPVNYYSIEGMGHLKTEAEREDRKPYIKKVGQAGGWSFINRRAIKHFKGLPNILGIDYMNPDGRGKMTDFSYDPLVQHGTGHSVMYWMLQLACHMASETVLIVGLDHRFSDGDWHPWDDEGPFDVMTKERLPRWAIGAVPYYKRAADAIVAKGKTVLNLTSNTALPDGIIPHGEIGDWLS